MRNIDDINRINEIKDNIQGMSNLIILCSHGFKTASWSEDFTEQAIRTVADYLEIKAKQLEDIAG